MENLHTANNSPSKDAPGPEHLHFTIDEASALTYKQSEEIEADGLRWFLAVHKQSEGEGLPDFLTVGLLTRENKSTIWNAEVSVTFSLVHVVDRTKTIKAESKSKFDHKNLGGLAKIIEWDRLVNEEEGFITADQFSIEAQFTVGKTSGIRRSTRFDFTDASDSRHDVCLIVEGRRLHVGRQYLSMHSPVFHAMFYGNFDEKNKKEIELKDVNCDEFIHLLNVIYPSFDKITDANVEYLLALGDRFEIKYVIDECERVLISTGKYTNIGKFRLADQYRLIELQDHCLGALAEVADISALQYSSEFEELSSDAKASILHHFMRLTKESH